MTTNGYRQVRPPYASDRGFAGQPPARLARLALIYGALAADRAAPGALRDYSSRSLAEIRAELTRQAPPAVSL